VDEKGTNSYLKSKRNKKVKIYFESIYVCTFDEPFINNNNLIIMSEGSSS